MGEKEEELRNQTKITKEPIVIKSENERINSERNDYLSTSVPANDDAGACISSDVPVSIVQIDENEQAKQDRNKTEELMLDGNGLETLNELDSGYAVVNQGPVMDVTTPEEQKSKVNDKRLQKEKKKQEKLLKLEENRKQKEMKAQMKTKKEESKTEMKRKNDEMQKILKKRWLNQEEMKAAKNSEGTRTDTDHIDSPETLARPESILEIEHSAIEIENTENINPFLMEFAESVSSDIIKEAKAQNTQEEDIDEEIEHQTEQETIIINAANNSPKVEGSSIGIDVSENDGIQTGSTTIMSGADVEKILRIIKETDEEFKEKEKQILDEFERRRKEENIKEMEKELKKQKREQEKLRKV